MNLLDELRRDAVELRVVGLPREKDWKPLSERAADEIERLGKAHARMKAEATAIADALGARGLIDFADDVRMLTKL